MEAVKGEKGQWHLTHGGWRNSKLVALCGADISPHYRREGKHIFKLKLCDKCRTKYNALAKKEVIS